VRGVEQRPGRGSRGGGRGWSAGKQRRAKHLPEEKTTTNKSKHEKKLTSFLPLFPHHSPHANSALAVDIGNATSSTSSWEDLVLSSDAQSYSEQYDRLFAALPLDVKKVSRNRGFWLPKLPVVRSTAQ